MKLLASTLGAIFASGALLFAPTPAHADSTWRANDDDALLFDLRSGQYRLGDGVRGYRTDAGICVDFADIIMSFDIPVRLDKKSRRATGWIFDENQTLTIERDGSTVQNMNTVRKLGDHEIYDTPEGWCVNVDSLSKWFDIRLKPDLGNALLVVESDKKLPFERAFERKERAARIRPTTQFDLSTLPQSSQPYKFWRTPSVDVVVSAGGLKNKGEKQDFDLRYELFASGEIGKASFDARISSDNSGIPESLRLRAYRTDPKGELLGPLGATHFAVGDVSTLSTPLVSQSTIGRGAFVTNRPVDQPDNFDRTSFRGNLPQGWDAELYRNGQLLAFSESRSDGRYEFIDIPLLYGQNRFEVVLYGPQGQIKRDSQSVSVGVDSIPPRKTYYWAGVQEADRDLINLNNNVETRQRGWRGGIGLERGLNTRTSVGFSLSSLQLDKTRFNYLEGSIRRAVGPALLEVSASSDLGSGMALRGQLLGELGNTYITAETIWSRGGYRSDRIEQNISSSHRVSLDHNFKLGAKLVPFHIDTEYETTTDGGSKLGITGRSSLNFKRLSLTGEINWERQNGSRGFKLPDRTVARFLANGRVAGIRVRGEATYQIAPEKRFEKVNFTGEWSAGERSDWRAELGYDTSYDRARAAIGIIRRFEKFALTATAEGASDGSVAAGVNLAFSFGPDPRTNKVRFSSNKLASTGQALAIVFRDKNRDGIRQDDEPLVKDVELTAGQSTALTPTNAMGRAIIDNLTPFRPILIGVDASSLNDPYVQPSLPGVVVTPRPGVATIVELPLVGAGEVEGTLMRQGGGILSGVGLELLDKAGRVTRRTVTEFDGFFLFESVPFGQYTLRIEKLSAQAVDVQALLGLTMIVDDDNQIAKLGAVVALSQTKTAEISKDLVRP